MKELSYLQIIAGGFLGVILLGALLLALPVASKTGMPTSFVDALFTAASATCVTGLVVVDTYTHWSVFGQIVILSLIQIGGLGFMSFIVMVWLFLGRKIGMRERNLLRASISVTNLGGVVRLAKHILWGTLIFEAAGAILLSLRFYPQMGFGQGLYYGIFHSISAFCNAGFDLMGKFGQYSSLTTFAADGLLNAVIMFLIVIGGIGFFVWEDVYTHKLKFRKYSLHSKMVLMTTLILILGGAVAIFISEYQNAFAGMPLHEAIYASFFQSITPRTAGFNTVDLQTFNDATIFLIIFLMIVGGSSGSTAGGIKTTTLAVLWCATMNTIKKRRHVNVFSRRLEDDAVARAATVLVLYLGLIIVSVFLLCGVEGISMKESMFEVASALGTVGLSLGATLKIGIFGKILLTFLMYFGRVSTVTIVVLFIGRKEPALTTWPMEKINIG